MMDSAQFPVEKSATSPASAVDIELENKVKKASEKISENLHIFANEPSLACYRLQEHIQKSLPQLVMRKLEVNHIQKDLQGKCYDLDYCINALKSMQKSQDTFLAIESLLKTAIARKHQLSQVDAQKNDQKKKPSPSMYQRFSGSFDLPSSFLPSGLSSSASASADLKSSTVVQRTLSSRRARASSVSSTSSAHPPVTRAHSSSCSPSTSRKPNSP